MKKEAIEKLAWFRFYQSPSKKNSWYRIAHRYLTKQISIEIHADVVAAKRNGPWSMKRDLKKVSMSGWIMMSSIFLCCISLSLSLTLSFFSCQPMQPKYAEMVLFLVGKLKPDLCEGEKDFVTKVEVHQRHISVTFSRQQQLQSPFCCSRVRFTKCQQMRIMRIYLSIKSLLGSQRPRREDMSRKVVRSN